MGGFGQNDKFQERLNRIQSENGGGQPPKGPTGSKRATGGRGMGVRLAGFGLVITLVLGVFGGAIYGVKKFSASLDAPMGKMLKDGFLKSVFKEPKPSAYDGLLTSGPKERKQYDTGWELPSPYVAAQGRTDLLLEQIAVAAQGTQNASDIAPEVITFPLNTACTLRRPTAGEVVHNVRLQDSARYTNTHMFSKAELAKAVHDRIEGITRGPMHYQNAAIAKGRMGYVDVFVTDTSAPVYLVLQNFNHDILWNIHLAAGARLAHVAMIGNKSGFAAPEGEHSFEALRIEDFIDGDDLYDNDTLRPCMIAPWNKPDPDWPLMQKLNSERDGTMYRRQLSGITKGHAAFNSWYTEQTGVDSEHNLATAQKAAHVLAGPLPATPVVMQALEQRTLRVAQNDYVTFGETGLLALHDDLLMAATGGDLSILNQPAMERVQK